MIATVGEWIRPIDSCVLVTPWGTFDMRDGGTATDGVALHLEIVDGQTKVVGEYAWEEIKVTE